MGVGKIEEANAAKEQTAQFKLKEQTLKDEVSKLEEQIQELLYDIPNVPQNIVPAGKSEDDNEIVEEVGQKVQFSGTPLPHWELAKKYDIIDFELGVKVDRKSTRLNSSHVRISYAVFCL